MEMKELCAARYANFQKALNREEGAYVPNTMINNGGGFFWGGKTVLDVQGDQLAFADAITKPIEEMWMDGNIFSGLTTSPGLNVTFPGSENKIAKDGTLTHLQVPQMNADEYDELAKDPESFIMNVLIPRKHAHLFEDRDAAKEALKIYAKESMFNIAQQTGITNKWLADKYGVFTFVTMRPVLNTPLDHLFDYFRGFRGTLSDLRRYPDKVKKALDAIWEYRCADMLSRPHNAEAGFPFQPCHIPAYLSPKQYKELYWPYEKQLIEWLHKSGSKVFLIMEGRWEKIWDCFLDVPKDSCVLCVDDDDFLKAHEVLGHHQILCGGLKVADTRLKSFEDIKDDVKRVIDTCAPGGGFLFNSDKGWLTPGDVNQTLIDAYNFAHEYSSK